jgi:hypothetical protein
MKKYLCPKINLSLEVSNESYELCSDCRESDSAKLTSTNSSKSGTKTEVKGESLVCCYDNGEFDIPIPSQSMIGGIMTGLARIVVQERIPERGPHNLRIIT